MVNVPLNSEPKLNETESSEIDPSSVATVRDTSRADAVFRGTQVLLGNFGWNTLCEVTLKNNRRADIMAINHKGEILIVEVKSCLADFASDEKWPEYREFCDYFYFAVDMDFPKERLPDEVGIIIADGFGGDFIRHDECRKMAGARRKAITLKFARLAASRLYKALTPSVV